MKHTLHLIFLDFIVNYPLNGYYTSNFLLIFFKFLLKWLQKFIIAKVPTAHTIDIFQHFPGANMAVIIRFNYSISSAFQGLLHCTY